MKRFYGQFRIILLTLAIGLASVTFYKILSEKWTEVQVDLPQVESSTPIYITPFASQENETIIQDRNLSLYDFGGKILNCDEFEKTEAKICEDETAKARSFIWEHFKNKKLGYIINEVRCDYSYCEEYFFIEPNENDKWQIVKRKAVAYSWGDQIFQQKYQSLWFFKSSENDQPNRLLGFCNENGMCFSSL